jgi:hypothetical protein
MSDTRYYEVNLEINGGVGFTVLRSAAPKPKQELGRGVSQDIGGALCAIEQLLGTDAGARRDRLFRNYFSDTERALLVYGLGLAKGIAAHDVLKSALQKLGVVVELDAPPP